jgi:hypothetical protein
LQPSRASVDEQEEQEEEAEVDDWRPQRLVRCVISSMANLRARPGHPHSTAQSSHFATQFNQ